jgi:hypothetical protein
MFWEGGEVGLFPTVGNKDIQCRLRTGPYPAAADPIAMDKRKGVAPGLARVGGAAGQRDPSFPPGIGRLGLVRLPSRAGARASVPPRRRGTESTPASPAGSLLTGLAMS